MDYQSPFNLHQDSEEAHFLGLGKTKAERVAAREARKNKRQTKKADRRARKDRRREEGNTLGQKLIGLFDRTEKEELDKAVDDVTQVVDEIKGGGIAVNTAGMSQDEHEAYNLTPKKDTDQQKTIFLVGFIVLALGGMFFYFNKK